MQSELVQSIIRYGLIFIGSVLGGGLALLILITWLSPPLNFIGQPYVVAKTAQELTSPQSDSILELIKLGVVIPIDTALGQLVGFYSAIINILIGLIAGINLVAYMYIRSKSMEHAEDTANKSVERCIKIHFDSEGYHSKVKEIAATHFDSSTKEIARESKANLSLLAQDLVDGIEKVKSCPEDILKLKQDIDALADLISEKSSDEEK